MPSRRGRIDGWVHGWTDGWDDPSAVAVEDRLFRALAVLRVVVLANALAFNAYRHTFDHPAAAVALLAAMTAWTGVAIWAYARPALRTPVLLVTDLAMALLPLLLTPVVKGPAFHATIPGFWVMGALLAWAIHWRWLGGLVAAACLSAADLLVRDHLTQGNVGNVFLLMIGGPIVGFMCEQLTRSAAERSAAERAAAVAGERARLARAVHDGVLQVLALVQRRGPEIGGEAVELGRLAGEQESRLRALIREQDRITAPRADAEVDLAAELSHLERRPGVTVALPGVPVLLPGHVAAELVAVVGACLDNVAVHVGPDAPAWVLLEDVGSAVELSVRDEGPGIPDGRLDEAAAAGRLGVSESIRGRVAELGGEAVLTTGGFGTEWEIRVPR